MFIDDLVQRPTVARINLDHLAHNYHQIRSITGKARMMAIVKANAYGHGLIPVARHLETLGTDMLGVAFIEEGVALRRAGIGVPILVMGGISADQIHHFIEHRLQITVSSIEKLILVEEVAAKMGRKAYIHLKFDTGLERIGVRTSNAGSFIDKALKSRHCVLEGIFSHLACADEPDNPMTLEQIGRFEEIAAHFAQHHAPIPCRHLANSGGILHFPQTHCDMVRPGLLLYGVLPGPLCQKRLDLKPVLSMHSKIVYFKVVKAGRSVSYGATWTADHMVRVVTVPIGYGDGYPRALSNRGEVLINGRRYAIVGSICMDQFMVNIEWDSAYNGDEVVLIGNQGQESITIEALAEKAGTVPYEMLTSLNNRVPRSYIKDNQAYTPED